MLFDLLLIQMMYLILSTMFYKELGVSQAVGGTQRLERMGGDYAYSLGRILFFQFFLFYIHFKNITLRNSNSTSKKKIKSLVNKYFS